LRKQRKIKVNNSCKNQSENKKSSNFFAVRQNITALRKKDESLKSKRGQKQANYFEISRISTVLNQWPFSSFLSGSVVAE